MYYSNTENDTAFKAFCKKSLLTAKLMHKRFIFLAWEQPSLVILCYINITELNCPQLFSCSNCESGAAQPSAL